MNNRGRSRSSPMIPIESLGTYNFSFATLFHLFTPFRYRRLVADIFFFWLEFIEYNRIDKTIRPLK